jgi:hypothetical protein
LFSLAFSILFLAQSVPSTSATPSDAVPAVQVADTLPAALPQTQPVQVPAPLATQLSAQAIQPSTHAAQITISGAPDAGTIVKGAIVAVDTSGNTIKVKTDASAAPFIYMVSSSTAITLDGAPSNLPALASIGAA